MIGYLIWIAGVVLSMAMTCIVVYQQKGDRVAFQVAIIYSIAWPIVIPGYLGFFLKNALEIFVEKLTAQKQENKDLFKGTLM